MKCSDFQGLSQKLGLGPSSEVGLQAFQKNGPLARPRPGRPITNWVFLSQSNDINF